MPYTDEDLLDALRGFADDHDGRPPTATEANDREELPVAATFVNRFGAWNAAIAEAGFEPRDRRRSDEDLLNDLRELAENDEQPMRASVANHEDMAHPSTYRDRFGSWSAALDAAGLPTFDS